MKVRGCRTKKTTKTYCGIQLYGVWLCNYLNYDMWEMFHI